MEDFIFAAFYLQAVRPHQSAAGIFSVARRIVHVAAVEAFRAVVGISVPGNQFSAVFADKILNLFLKS